MLIIGGGFGGLHVARGLRRTNANLLIVDKHNYHLFQPLLYQVATAVLSPADIATPIRRIFRHQQNVTVAMAEVTGVDLDAQRVTFPEGSVTYDYLVLAAGATHSYFGNDHWADEAPGLKTVDDALEIRRRLLAAFEAAEFEDDEAARKAKLTFVIVGGGPTGVELAGAIKEIAVETLTRDFRRIDTTTARIVLVQGGDELLEAMPAACRRRARADLEKMGVELVLGRRVTDVNEDGVKLDNGHFIDATNIFWAAGVKPSPLAKTLGVELDRAGRVLVQHDLSLPGHPEVFCIGDMAHYDDPKLGGPVPGLAQGAMQMGDFVAKIIRDRIAHNTPIDQRPTFTYRDKGTMATIGRAKAVASVAGRQFGGLLAWLLWGVVHVMFLVSFRNKVFVMLAWVWNYVVAAKGARLITGEVKAMLKKPAGVEPVEACEDG